MSRNIKVLHLEPTDVCQAACPLCPRETNTEFDKLQQHHLSMHTILGAFSTSRIQQLDKMFMCGNYGDPAAGKYTLDIYQTFRKINHNIVLGMNTNGGLQNSTWWNKLGRIFNQPFDYTVFSIDGLEDTNSVYRQNVSWQKLMSNARSYIEAGGSAHWDMLVYRHNQHQVDECEQLAKDMGFTWFRAKVSKRGFTNQLEQPIGWHDPQVQSNTINCHALVEQSLYIDAQGRTNPCCWLGSKQKNLVINFDDVKASWTNGHPNTTCAATCGTTSAGSSFSNQWQRNTQLK